MNCKHQYYFYTDNFETCVQKCLKCLETSVQTLNTKLPYIQRLYDNVTCECTKNSSELTRYENISSQQFIIKCKTVKCGFQKIINLPKKEKVPKEKDVHVQRIVTPFSKEEKIKQLNLQIKYSYNKEYYQNILDHLLKEETEPISNIECPQVNLPNIPPVSTIRRVPFPLFKAKYAYMIPIEIQSHWFHLTSMWKLLTRSKKMYNIYTDRDEILNRVYFDCCKKAMKTVFQWADEKNKIDVERIWNHLNTVLNDCSDKY